MKNKILACLLGGIAALSLASCGGNENTIIIGTMAEPGLPVIENIKDDFEAKGYKLEIVTLSSFDTGNPALADGSIDANLFQHKPYLDNYNAQNNGTLISATTVYTCTYGGYSKKLSNIEDLKTVYAETNVSPRVTIANDYSNGLRCLNILKNYGLIDFDAEAYANNITDISACLTKNDYHLNIQAISTALIASSLEDSDCYLGIVNATYALNAGLSSDLLLCEEPEATNIENANIIAIRQEDKDEQWVKDLIECITSDSSKEFIENNFNGVVQPYFDIAI